MSQYIEFYIKNDKLNKDDPDSYTFLTCFSRNHYIYELFKNAPYENAAPLTLKNLEDACKASKSEIEYWINKKEILEQNKDKISSFNNTVYEKLEAYREIDKAIDEYNELIEERKYAFYFVKNLLGIIDYHYSGEDQESSDNEELVWYGIECGHLNDYPPVDKEKK